MKKSMLIFLFLLSINSLNAQLAENHSIYATTELNFGNYRGGLDLNLNYVHQKTYSFKLGYSFHARLAESTPDDYSVGLINFFLRGFGFIDNPYDQLHNYKLTVGGIYPLTESGKVWANLSAGIGYTVVKGPENWEKNPNFLIENYTWNYKKTNAISFILNPKIEFALTNWYGLTISPLFILNSQSSYFGIGFGQIIGLLKKRSK